MAVELPSVSCQKTRHDEALHHSRRFRDDDFDLAAPLSSPELQSRSSGAAHSGHLAGTQQRVSMTRRGFATRCRKSRGLQVRRTVSRAAVSRQSICTDVTLVPYDRVLQSMNRRLVLGRPSGPDVLQAFEKARMRRLPTKRGPITGTRRGLSHREDRPEGPEHVLRHRLYRHAESLSCDCRDVADSVAFVADGVPGCARGADSSTSRKGTAASSACTAGQRCVPSPGYPATPVRRARSVRTPRTRLCLRCGPCEACAPPSRARSGPVRAAQ